MQLEQTKNDNAKASVYDFFKTNNAQFIGYAAIDYSDRAFDTQANAQVEMSGKSALDTGTGHGEVNPPADSNSGSLITQINLSPNTSSTTQQTNRTNSRGRPDVTFFDRLQIAARFWDPERPWGEITQLASQYNLSRQSIYEIAYRIELLFSTPSVQPTLIPPPVFPSTLFTPQDMLNLRTRLILTSVFPGGVTMRPLEDILAEVPFIDSPSDTTIWRIVNQAGEEADEILSQVDYSQIKLPPVLVAVDETFFNGSPILLVVEPTSLAVCVHDRSPRWRPFCRKLECCLRASQKRTKLKYCWWLR